MKKLEYEIYVIKFDGWEVCAHYGDTHEHISFEHFTDAKNFAKMFANLCELANI